MKKYEIQNRYFEALAKPGALNTETIYEEIDAQLEAEMKAALEKVRKTFKPLFDFNDAQRDETRLVLSAYFNENSAMREFALSYVRAASAAVNSAAEDDDAET